MSPIRKSQSAWKEKHLEFVRAVRQARGISEGHGKRSLPSAVAQSRPAVHEKCPHCERNFGPKAFDRHIEWCKEQKARIPKSPASILAKERLEARTKVYRLYYVYVLVCWMRVLLINSFVTIHIIGCGYGNFCYHQQAYITVFVNICLYVISSVVGVEYSEFSEYEGR